MENRGESKGQRRWFFGILAVGVLLMLYACDQQSGQSGQSGLANKPPPSLGAIAEVDGSDDTKKEGKKPQAGTEQAPAQSPAGSQPAQGAPKQ
jgi:hypothetical protein